MRIKTLFIILILSLVLLPATPALAQEVTAEDITDQLICQCDCGLILSVCDCAVPDGGIEMKTIISEQLAQGGSEEEILVFFVAQYGEQVLAPPPNGEQVLTSPPTPTTTPPPKQDSNLVLWISVLIGISAVGAVIYLTQKKRARGK